MMQSTSSIQQFNALLQTEEPNPLLSTLRQISAEACPEDIRQLSFAPGQGREPVDPQVSWGGWAW